jgi:ribosomal-protein-serine acetyltransferase
MILSVLTMPGQTHPVLPEPTGFSRYLHTMSDRYAITPRCTMRLIAAGDHEALFAVIDRNRERLRAYFPGTTKAMESLAAAGEYVETRVQQAVTKDGFCFVLAEDEAIIGLVIIKEINWRVPKCELAYFIDAAYEGKGLITAAVKQTVQYCFEVLHMEKICIMLSPDNDKSRNVALRSGFVKEGHMRHEFRTGHDMLTDVEYYGLSRR